MYIRSCYMFRHHVGHHQATLIGETTALYTLSLVPSSTSLLLFIYFVGYFHPILLAAVSLLCILYIIYIVACHLKAGLPESRRASIATQRIANTFPQQQTDAGAHRYTASR
jgi:hypothetical protein